MVKKMSNAEIIARVNGISAIQAREKDGTVLGRKTKVMYAVVKNKEKMIELLRPYHIALEQLIQDCQVTKKDTENGEVFVPADEFKQRWVESLMELQSILIDVPVFQINIDDLEGSSLTLSEFECISFMVADPE